MKSYLTARQVEFQLANSPQITFEVTDRCNLSCTYCGYGELYCDYDARENTNLKPEQAFRLLDYLSGLWSSSLNVSHNRNLYVSFYGGEPLLNMELIQKVVSYLEQLDCPSRTFTFSMTTNALLLHKYIDYLVEHNFKLLVSLDGNRENTGYRVDKAGNPSFDRIIENVDLVRSRYPEYFASSVNFNAVLHNKNSVESIYSFFKERYDKMPRIGELNNMGIREEKKDVFERAYRNTEDSLQQAEHYTEIMKDMALQLGSYQTVSTYVLQYNPFVYRNYNELLFGKSIDYADAAPTGTCMPFSKKVYVTVNGKILPCERIGHQYALGRVTDSAIEIDPEAIAAKYNEYYAKLDKQCSTCCQRRSCVQCIYNLEDLDKRPVCLGHYNQAEFERYEQAQWTFLAKNPREYYKIMEDIVVV